jgi:hypothetical protein
MPQGQTPSGIPPNAGHHLFLVVQPQIP